jgi:hypothetical protein
MSKPVEPTDRFPPGTSFAEQAGIIRTVRLPDGTEYKVLREDIYQHALQAASELLIRCRGEDILPVAPPAVAPDRK